MVADVLDPFRVLDAGNGRAVFGDVHGWVAVPFAQPGQNVEDAAWVVHPGSFRLRPGSRNDVGVQEA
jgi:hypothetical protein